MNGLMKDPSKLNFWGRLQQRAMMKDGLMKGYQEQQGREDVKGMVGTRQTPYEMSDEELFPGEAQETAAPGLMTKGTGLVGGEMSPLEFYGGLMSTPGYQQIGAQGLSGLMQSRGGVKPTTLMQNVGAAGYQQGTPEYQEQIKKYLSKPTTQINMGTKAITAADAQQMRNDKGNMPPIGMNWDQAGQAGYRFINKEEEKKAGEDKEVIGSMAQSLDAYKTLLKKQGAMNVVDMFTNPSDYNKLDAAYGQLQLEYKELAKLGVLTGPDMDLIERVMIDPTSIRANATQYFSNKDALYKQLDVVGEKISAARKRAVARYGKNWRGQSDGVVNFEDL